MINDLYMYICIDHWAWLGSIFENVYFPHGIKSWQLYFMLKSSSGIILPCCHVSNTCHQFACHTLEGVAACHRGNTVICIVKHTGRIHYHVDLSQDNCWEQALYSHIVITEANTVKHSNSPNLGWMHTYIYKMIGGKWPLSAWPIDVHHLPITDRAASLDLIIPAENVSSLSATSDFMEPQHLERGILNSCKLGIVCYLWWWRQPAHWVYLVEMHLDWTLKC